MGFTIEDALVQTQEQYHLKLLAGREGCSNAMSWVHMIEDNYSTIMGKRIGSYNRFRISKSRFVI